MAAGFEVTPAALATLSASAAGIRDRLSVGVRVDCGPALGSAVVAAALSQFVSGWRDGRAQICAEVSDLSSALAAAASAYAATEGDLAAAIS
jgi:hypothetical protein